jgi:hypothetical protein
METTTTRCAASGPRARRRDVASVGAVVLRALVLLATAVGVPSRAAGGAADPFVGRFSTAPGAASPMDVEVSAAPAAPGRYVGTIHFRGRDLPLTAQADQGRLGGTFTSGGSSFTFTARLTGDDIMTLESGGASYTLGRAASSARHALRMNRATIHDDLAQLDAATLLVPDGWRVESQIDWQMNPFKPASVMWRAADPNGADAVTAYPEARYLDGFRERIYSVAVTVGGPAYARGEAAKYPDGTRVYAQELRTRPADPGGYVRQTFAAQVRPDLASARLVEERDEPELARAALVPFAGLNARVRVSRLRYEYALGDRPIQEQLFCTLLELTNPDGTVGWGASVLSCRAAKGDLDRVVGLSRILVSSVIPDLGWYAKVVAVADMAMKVARSGQDAQARRAQILAQAQAQVDQTMRDQYSYQQKLQQQSFAKWDEVIRGVETRYDPIQERQIEVPASYRQVFVSPQHEYILSDDVNYRPPSTEWQSAPLVSDPSP